MEKQNKKNKKINIYKYINISLSLILLIFIVMNVQDKKVVKFDNISIEEYKKMGGNTTITGRVIVKYVDDEGNKLLDDTILTGTVGEIYQTTRPEVDAFKAYGNDPINKTGNFDAIDTVVTYVYQRKNDSVNINNENNVITVQVLYDSEGKEVAQEVKMNIVTKSKEGEILTGATYLVKDSNSKVIRNATSYVEKLLVGSLPITSEGTDSFYIKETVPPNSYIAYDEEIQVNVTKVLNSETNKYEVVAELNTNYEGVSITWENGEIVVTIENTKAEEQKVFDLKIEKDISEVKVMSADKTEVKTKNSADEIIKVDIPKSKISDTELQVKYALKVTNVGEVAGYAKEVTDIIPDGMTLIEGGNWVTDGNKAINTGIGDSLIQPGESETIYINLSWKLELDNVGLKINVAKISIAANDEGIEDSNYSNDYDSEGMITAPRTGLPTDYAIPVLIGLIILTVILQIVRAYGKNK